MRVRFLDRHRVTARAGAASATLTYAQMGMADGRTAGPTVQWELLRTFARNNGTLTWGASGAHRRNQKRVEVLAKNLKAFFRIEGEPVRYDPAIKGWRAVLTVEGD